MKEEDKNRKTDLNDFLRYTSKEMTGRERNAFERELQKDPFSEDAAEGLSGLSPGEALKDVTSLNKKLQSGVTRRQRFVYYRIAASVAVLMLFSSVFFFINRSKNAAENIEIALNTPAPLEITESKAISEPVNAASETVAADKSEPSYKDKASEIADETGLAAGQKNAENFISARKADIMAVSNPVTDDIYLAEEKEIAMAPAAAMARSETLPVIIKGRVISSEDNQPVPGASVIVKGTSNGVLTDNNGNFNITIADKADQALQASYIGMETKEFKAEADTQLQVKLEPSLHAFNEVVVVAYGESGSKKAGAAEKAVSDDMGYSAPEPVGGQYEFDSYIEKNIRKPVTQPEGERVVVIINFTVKSNGTIENIKTIRSPDEEYSAEAARLLREGPSWKPAMQNGEKIDDEVRVRIVFK
jgi:hypothetical protein